MKVVTAPDFVLNDLLQRVAFGLRSLGEVNVHCLCGSYEVLPRGTAQSADRIKVPLQSRSESITLLFRWGLSLVFDRVVLVVVVFVIFVGEVRVCATRRTQEVLSLSRQALGHESELSDGSHGEGSAV